MTFHKASDQWALPPSGNDVKRNFIEEISLFSAQRHNTLHPLGQTSHDCDFLNPNYFGLRFELLDLLSLK